MAQVKSHCDMCDKPKLNVERVPSRKQLLFGGFNVLLENRCPACERKVAKWLDKLLGAALTQDPLTTPG